MPLRPSLALLAVLSFLAALALGAYFALRIRHVLESKVARRRAQRGLLGEKRAEALLARHGYQVLERQVTGGYAAELDGEARQVVLRADLLVERHGRRCIAEVKTGLKATRFEHVDTRRQLLEYQLAFGGDAVLLVDEERGTIHEVRFPMPVAPARGPGLWWMAILAAGALIALLARA